MRSLQKLVEKIYRKVALKLVRAEGLVLANVGAGVGEPASTGSPEAARAAETDKDEKTEIEVLERLLAEGLAAEARPADDSGMTKLNSEGAAGGAAGDGVAGEPNGERDAYQHKPASAGARMGDGTVIKVGKRPDSGAFAVPAAEGEGAAGEGTRQLAGASAEGKEGKPVKEAISVTVDQLSQYVGQPPHFNERLYKSPPPGVVMGLAWTFLGGATLFVESTGRLPLGVRSDHRPPRENGPQEEGVHKVHEIGERSGGGPGSMKVTGQLGKVMSESSMIALTFAREFAMAVDPENDFLERANLHLHVPEGATPKDGPSAGVTMATSLLSLASGRSVPPEIAMTGELTLTGKVIRVGGVKEKTIAAKRDQAEVLIFPRQNECDYRELKHYLRVGLTAHFVDHYADVYRLIWGALDATPAPVEGSAPPRWPAPRVITVRTPAEELGADAPGAGAEKEKELALGAKPGVG